LWVGGTSANSDGGGTWQPTPADLAFIDSFCASSDACCVATGETPVQGNCRNKLEDQGLSRDESLRSACLARLQQLAGSASCLPEQGALDDPCMRIVYEPSGPLQPGQHCTRNADCAGQRERHHGLQHRHDPGDANLPSREPRDGGRSPVPRHAVGDRRL
jgi:hypothetical protein